MDRTKRELMQIDNEILSLEDRKFHLDGQLAQLKPDVPVISSRGERTLSPEDRLKSLKMEFGYYAEPLFHIAFNKAFIFCRVG